MTDSIRGLTRRELLLRTGWLALGVTVVAGCGSLLPALPSRRKPSLDDALVWVQLLPDGRLRFLCPRAEMGQGIATGLVQVVAEELSLAPELIECVFPDTDAIAPTLMTVGSLSMLEYFTPVSEAAATLRERLRGRAASRAGIAASEVRHEGAGFRLPDGSRMTYEALASGAPDVLDAREGAVHRYTADPTRTRSVVGRTIPCVGGENIVTGREVYSRDVRVPGMLYARLARPPRAGARLVSADESGAAAIPGVAHVVVDRDLSVAAVVARNPFVLDAALARLAPRFEGGDPLDAETLDALLDVDAAGGGFQHEACDEGDVEGAAARAVQSVDARYETPAYCHAAMEPRAAVAHVRPERVDVWGASQDPFLTRGRVARVLGRSDEDVVVHPHRLGGGFGGRGLCQAAEEAAWLSSRVGAPVRVHWTREEEFRHNLVHPPFRHRIRAGVTADGGIAFWSDEFVSCPIIFTSGIASDRLHWLLDIPADPGTARNAIPPYAIADLRVRYSDVRIPLVTGAWRGLGAAPNAFAVESAMDELALLSGVDPLAFRLRHVPAERPRLSRVLRRAAERAGWGEPLPPGRGRGIACAVYKDETYVAIVTEVAVAPESNALRVARVVCAHDCGLIVSPDRVRAQIEGNVAWGVSMALHEEAPVAAGRVAVTGFDGYTILRNSGMPRVDIELLEDPEVPPGGAGEPALVPVAAAIANAVQAATGLRLRTLPLRLPSGHSTESATRDGRPRLRA